MADFTTKPISPRLSGCKLFTVRLGHVLKIHDHRCDCNVRGVVADVKCVQFRDGDGRAGVGDFNGKQIVFRDDFI